MATIFEKAKGQSIKKVVEKHEVVSAPELEANLEKMAEIDVKLAELEAERSVLDSVVRETAKSKMLSVYESKGFPGTLKVEAGKMSFLFITSDRYGKIDEDRFKELSSKYGPEMVEEDTKFFFNTEVLEKYQDVISELISKCNKISDVDKENLIESTTNFSVCKGVVKDLLQFAKKSKSKLIDVVNDISPVFSIKSIK